jgi:hypothetical protein
MSKVDKVPEWARLKAFNAFERACGFPEQSEVGIRWLPALVDAFARYIAEHEEPPVDPLTNVLAEVYSCWCESDAARVREALAKSGLKIVDADGIELAGGAS